MRITKISVTDLFGIFNHQIPLNSDDRITIIHGPNGIGKTVLLTVTNAVLTGRNSVLRTVPFSNFSLTFDGGFTLSLRKSLKGQPENEALELTGQDLVFELRKSNLKPKYHTVKPLREMRMHFPLGMIDQEVPGIERIGQTTWLFAPTQETLSLEEVLDRFGDRLPVSRELRSLKDTEPAWLREIRGSVPIRFIETQRLLAATRARRPRDPEGRTSMIPAVINYSEELVTMIQSKLAEYASLSQSLDRSFPTRLVKGVSATQQTIEQLREDLKRLEEKRTRLMVAGLLDKEQEIDFREFFNIDPTNRHVLSVYIDDVKQKLGVFDELTNKIDLLVKIVNNRFLYKQMSIGKKDGFVFRASNEKKVPSPSLSSGEQHELVLFYELLFKVKPNSLILIDEPELSLHVAWQQQFLDDLHEIARLSDVDILIATHSPQIIHDRWDLTVQLKGPDNA